MVAYLSIIALCFSRNLPKQSLKPVAVMVEMVASVEANGEESWNWVADLYEQGFVQSVRH